MQRGLAALLGALDVLGERLLVVGVRALLDDDLRALARAQATQVGQTLLGDDDHGVVLGVVVVRDHGHDGGDVAVSGGGGGNDSAAAGGGGKGKKGKKGKKITLMSTSNRRTA